MGSYEGPYRHIQLTLRETDGGILCTGVTFDIVRGQRRFHRLLWRHSVDVQDRPWTAAGLLRLAADTLDPPAGA